MTDFNASFNKILAKRQAKQRRQAKAERLEFGSTARGQAQFQPHKSIHEDAVGGLKFQEIRYRSHATKAHRGRKTVRKVGVMWR